MNNYDYVILIDENGQPYIAHSVFTKARDAAKSAARSAHKYIARIGDRYFYTQEELKAFYNRGKAAAAKAAETVRGAATKAATTAKSAASSVSKYASDRLGDVSDFVHRRNKAKSSETSGITDREIDNSANKKGTFPRLDRLRPYVSPDNYFEKNTSRYQSGFSQLGAQPGNDKKQAEAMKNSTQSDHTLQNRDSKNSSKKRLGRGKTNEIAEIDPNTDVKGRMDSRNNSHSTDNTKSNAYLDKYQGPIPENRMDYEGSRQRLLQDVYDAQYAVSKNPYSEEGNRAREDLERARARLNAYYDSIFRRNIDDKYRASLLTKKKK